MFVVIGNVLVSIALETLGVAKCATEGEPGCACAWGEAGCALWLLLGYSHPDSKDDNVRTVSARRKV